MFQSLVLSSGASKGIAILGALQYLYINDLLTNIKHFVGTSIGSCLSYFLILGFTPLEIMAYANTNKLGIDVKLEQMDIIKLFEVWGICPFNQLEKHFEQLTLRKLSYIPTLKQLQETFDKSLHCVTFNLTTNQKEYLSPETHPNLSCLDAIHMSSNIPILFEKLIINEHMYVDGAIVEPFAWDYACRKFQSVIGVATEGIPTNIFQHPPDTPDLKTNMSGFLMYILSLIKAKQAIQDCWSNQSKMKKIIRIKIPFELCSEFDLCLRNKDRIKLFSLGFETAKQSTTDKLKLKVD